MIPYNKRQILSEIIESIENAPNGQKCKNGPKWNSRHNLFNNWTITDAQREQNDDNACKEHSD